MRSFPGSARQDKNGCLAIQHALEMAPAEMQGLIVTELKGKVSPGLASVSFLEAFGSSGHRIRAFVGRSLPL